MDGRKPVDLVVLVLAYQLTFDFLLHEILNNKIQDHCVCQLQEFLNVSLRPLMIATGWSEHNTVESVYITKCVMIRFTTQISTFIVIFNDWMLIQLFRKFHNKYGSCGVSNECRENLMELRLAPTIYEVDPLKFK